MNIPRPVTAHTQTPPVDPRHLSTITHPDGRTVTTTPFEHFPRGTNIEAIWAWLERNCLFLLGSRNLEALYPEV